MTDMTTTNPLQDPAWKRRPKMPRTVRRWLSEYLCGADELAVWERLNARDRHRVRRAAATDEAANRAYVAADKALRGRF